MSVYSLEAFASSGFWSSASINKDRELLDRIPFFPMYTVLAVSEALGVCLLGEDTDFAGFGAGQVMLLSW